MLGDLPKNDLNGDGRSDLIWTNYTARITTTWASNAGGGFDPNWWVVGPNYSILDVADFTKQGRAQVMLDNGLPVGQVVCQLSADASTTIDDKWEGGAPIHNGWAYLDSGDVNGDRVTDIIMMTGNGWFSTWIGRADGSGVQLLPKYIYLEPTWNVLCTGDFNGDGATDLLFRNTDGWVTNWLGTGTVPGSFVNNGAVTALFFDPHWYVIGAGDFNGDGNDDLLLRNTDGWITNWLANDDGGFTNNGANATTFLQPNWYVNAIGDFNGDGKDDLILRRDDGWITEWVGTANGSFANGTFTTFVSLAYHLQDNLVVDPRVYADPGFGAWEY